MTTQSLFDTYPKTQRNQAIEGIHRAHSTQIVSGNLGTYPLLATFFLAKASNGWSKDVGSHQRHGASHSVHGIATGKVHEHALEHPSVAVEDANENRICERYAVQTNQNSVIQELTYS